MGHIVVTLNVIKIDGLGDPIGLIQIPQIRKKIPVVGDPPNIAFEMPVIDRIEPNESHEKSQVCFQQRITEKVSLLLKPGFQGVECMEKQQHRLFVSLLGGSESGPVNAVV